MNFNMELPGLKGLNIEGIVEQENRILVYISMPVKEHICQRVAKERRKFMITGCVKLGIFQCRDVQLN